jgi:DNA-binding NarL/FixJ family response regulator
MDTTQIQQPPKQSLKTHTVVYSAITDIRCAVMAMQGQTTKSIARELGITEAKVQYRIQKAQDSLNCRFRADFRNGRSETAKYVLAASNRFAEQIVRKQIAPKFAPYSTNRPAA